GLRSAPPALLRLEALSLAALLLFAELSVPAERPTTISCASGASGAARTPDSRIKAAAPLLRLIALVIRVPPIAPGPGPPSRAAPYEDSRTRQRWPRHSIPTKRCSPSRRKPPSRK